MEIKLSRLTVLVGVGIVALALPLVGYSAEVLELLDIRHHESVPFSDQERASYEINWKPLFLVPAFRAGELIFSVRPSEFEGKPSYTITASTRSEGLLSSVAGLEVRDQFESIIDRTNFRSYRLFTRVRRTNKNRDVEVRYLYDQGNLSFQETNLDLSPPKVIRQETIPGIPTSVADILSVFYSLRLRPMKPGEEYWVDLGNGTKVTRVQVKVLKEEDITTPLGTFEAVELSTVGGLFSNGGDLRVWYSTDETRIPVQFEADAKFGSVYGQIVGLDTPKMSRSVIRLDN